MSDIEIQGLDELQAKLKKLVELAKDKKPLLAGGYVLQREAQQNAPVKTGFLRNSAYTEEVDDGVEVGFSADYAFPVEFGHGNVPPNGFFRRAIDEGKDKVSDAVANELKKEIGGL